MADFAVDVAEPLGLGDAIMLLGSASTVEEASASFAG